MLFESAEKGMFVCRSRWPPHPFLGTPPGGLVEGNGISMDDTMKKTKYIEYAYMMIYHLN
jgi:hypothetical protein